MSRPHGVHLFRLRLVEDTSWCLVGYPTNHPKFGNLFRVQPNIDTHILTQEQYIEHTLTKILNNSQEMVQFYQHASPTTTLLST